jgi:hypothetical protein
MNRLMQAQRSVFGPNPLVAACMLLMTILACLVAFRVTPHVPPLLGYLVLALLVASANLYWAGSMLRLWPRVVGGAGGTWQVRLRSKLRMADGTYIGSAALDHGVLKGYELGWHATTRRFPGATRPIVSAVGAGRVDVCIGARGDRPHLGIGARIARSNF